MSFTPEEKREYRRKLKARGICIRCYKRKAAPKRVDCLECLKEKSKHNALVRQDKTRCNRCQRKLNEMERYYCATCQERKLIRQWRKDHAKKSN